MISQATEPSNCRWMKGPPGCVAAQHLYHFFEGTRFGADGDLRTSIRMKGVLCIELQAPEPESRTADASASMASTEDRTASRQQLGHIMPLEHANATNYYPDV